MSERKDFGFVDWGQYQGKRWSIVPKEYLGLVVSGMIDASPVNRAKARLELEQRELNPEQGRLF